MEGIILPNVTLPQFKLVNISTLIVRTKRCIINITKKPSSQKKKITHPQYPPLPLEFQNNPATLDCTPLSNKKTKFDVVYVSQRARDYLTTDNNDGRSFGDLISKNNGVTVVVEMAKFVFPLTEGKRESLAERVQNVVEEKGWAEEVKFRDDGKGEDVLVFHKVP